MEPLISVGMPVRNCEETIGQAIRSILLQTYRRWELLIVDDGSSDGTIEVARGFVDNRIRIFHDREFRGLSVRLNEAILSREEIERQMVTDYPGARL